MTRTALSSAAPIHHAKIAASDRVHLMPALIAAAGARASYRFLEFFTAQIRNPHTRRAYARDAQHAAELKAEQAKTLKAIETFAALAERLDALANQRRPWWKRLAG